MGQDRSGRTTLTDEQRIDFGRRLRSWGRSSGRDFPWRHTDSPFEVLVAECLLRKTTGEAVLPVWQTLLRKYPSPVELASARLTDLQLEIECLGFGGLRSRTLVAAAAMLADSSPEPITPGALMQIPGVGRYTAAMTSTLLGTADVVPVDANVARVLRRAFGISPKAAALHRDEVAWRLAGQLAPPGAARATALGLIDLGGIVCQAREARCGTCPVQPLCRTGIQRLRDSR